MELERIALERASTAREAITIMGQMAEKYGYGDSGECLTVGDAKEVWQFEIFGAGPGRSRRGVGRQADPAGRSRRVGQPLPHHHARPTTRTSRCTRRTSTRWPRRNGWWKKGEPFVFNRAFGMSGAPTPNRREWRVLSILAPSLKLDPWAPRAAVLGEARQEGQRPRRDGDPSRRLPGHGVRSDQGPAGRARSARRTAGRCRRATSRRRATRRSNG